MKIKKRGGASGDSVTIFVQAHGSEDFSEDINLKGLRLLSFSGKMGINGQMNICSDNRPIDLKVLDLIRQIYLTNSSSQDAKNQKNTYENISQHLRKLYNDCGIAFTSGGGFVQTYPKKERTFYLQANPHENCERCVLTPGYGYCTDLPINKRICPEYGITVVASSRPQDLHYTLVGGTRQTTNLLSVSTTFDYWYNQCLNPHKYVYKEDILNNKVITLTDLYHFFKGMGFENIYIYDPSCRDTGKDASRGLHGFQSGVNTVMESKKFNERLYNPQLADVVKEAIRQNKSTEQNKPTEQNTMVRDYNPIENREPSFVGSIKKCVDGVCNFFGKEKTEGGNKTMRRRKRIIKTNKNKKNKTNRNRNIKNKTKRFTK
jgi:hypothetical protein